MVRFHGQDATVKERRQRLVSVAAISIADLKIDFGQARKGE